MDREIGGHVEPLPAGRGLDRGAREIARDRVEYARREVEERTDHATRVAVAGHRVDGQATDDDLGERDLERRHARGCELAGDRDRDVALEQQDRAWQGPMWPEPEQLSLAALDRDVVAQAMTVADGKLDDGGVGRDGAIDELADWCVPESADDLAQPTDRESRHRCHHTAAVGETGYRRPARLTTERIERRGGNEPVGRDHERLRVVATGVRVEQVGGNALRATVEIRVDLGAERRHAWRVQHDGGEPETAGGGDMASYRADAADTRDRGAASHENDHRTLLEAAEHRWEIDHVVVIAAGGAAIEPPLVWLAYDPTVWNAPAT